MVKWISAVLVILFGIVFTFILYLSTIGIETNSFNSFVQNKLILTSFCDFERRTVKTKPQVASCRSAKKTVPTKLSSN